MNDIPMVGKNFPLNKTSNIETLRLVLKHVLKLLHATLGSSGSSEKIGNVAIKETIARTENFNESGKINITRLLIKAGVADFASKKSQSSRSPRRLISVQAFDEMDDSVFRSAIQEIHVDLKNQPARLKQKKEEREPVKNPKPSTAADGFTMTKSSNIDEVRPVLRHMLRALHAELGSDESSEAIGQIGMKKTIRRQGGHSESSITDITALLIQAGVADFASEEKTGSLSPRRLISVSKFDEMDDSVFKTAIRDILTHRKKREAKLRRKKQRLAKAGKSASTMPSTAPNEPKQPVVQKVGMKKPAGMPNSEIRIKVRAVIAKITKERDRYRKERDDALSKNAILRNEIQALENEDMVFIAELEEFEK